MIVVIGRDGQLGSELCMQLSADSINFVGIGHGRDRDCTDISDKQQTKELLSSIHPNTVINTAAFTDVDACEVYPNIALRVNGIGVKNLAEICHEINATLVHISTDYVFGSRNVFHGNNSPISPHLIPKPDNTYGISKLVGEEFIKMIHANMSCIIRTSGLYGAGKNFVKTILTSATKGEKIPVITDQICCPTYTKDLAENIISLIKSTLALGKTFHIVNDIAISWFDFAKLALKIAGMDINLITKTESSKLARRAKRPFYSALSTYSVKSIKGIKIRPHAEALADYIKTYALDQKSIDGELTEEEWNSPITFDLVGNIISLRSYASSFVRNKEIIPINSLDALQKVKLTIARLNAKETYTMPDGSVGKVRAIEEAKENTDLGRAIIDIELQKAQNLLQTAEKTLTS